MGKRTSVASKLKYIYFLKVFTQKTEFSTVSLFTPRSLEGEREPARAYTFFYHSFFALLIFFSLKLNSANLHKEDKLLHVCAETSDPSLLGHVYFSFFFCIIMCFT